MGNLGFGELFLVVIIPSIFYLLCVQKTLKLAGPEHRKMGPSLVWLMLVPMVGFVWHFFMVKHVSDSVKSWANANEQNVGDAGWSIGLTGCILTCACILPSVGWLCGIGSLVCLTVWWTKVAKFNQMMASNA